MLGGDRTDRTELDRLRDEDGLRVLEEAGREDWAPELPPLAEGCVGEMAIGEGGSISWVCQSLLGDIGDGIGPDALLARKNSKRDVFSNSRERPASVASCSDTFATSATGIDADVGP